MMMMLALTSNVDMSVTEQKEGKAKTIATNLVSYHQGASQFYIGNKLYSGIINYSSIRPYLPGWDTNSQVKFHGFDNVFSYADGAGNLVTYYYEQRSQLADISVNMIEYTNGMINLGYYDASTGKIITKNINVNDAVTIPVMPIPGGIPNGSPVIYSKFQ